MNSSSAFLKEVTPKTESLPWLADAESLRAEKSVSWVKALRETGAEAFAGHGLPSPKEEGWQYTSLRSLSEERYRYSTAPVVFDGNDLPPLLLENAHRIVVVNGQYQADLSAVPEGARVLSLMQAAEEGMEGLEQHLAEVGDLARAPFRALNAAYLRDGFVLKIATNWEIDVPVEVLFLNTGGSGKNLPAFYPRVLYWLERGSRLTLLERHVGNGCYFTDSDVHIAQEADSVLKYYRFVAESDAASALHQVALQIEKNASFEAFSMAYGGRLVRQDFQMRLIDSGISASITGAYLLKGQQVHDFTILADHFEPDGKSVQHFKGVIDDKARAIFQGKIHVRRSAQKTNGYQSHHALLLSREAEASAKPELEIYADDVKCSHGATSGQLDMEALFYLRSRGIPHDEARALLIRSYLEDVLVNVTDESVRDIYAQKILAWLEERCR